MVKVIMKSIDLSREGKRLDEMAVLSKYLEIIFPFENALLEINTDLSSFRVNAVSLFYRSLSFKDLSFLLRKFY